MGDMWKEQRWFMLRYLRDFGFGRRHEEYEVHVHDEIRSFVEMVSDGPKHKHEFEIMKEGGLGKVPLLMTASITNCFLQILLSERLPREDHAVLFE